LAWNFLNNFHSLFIYIYAGSLFSLITVVLVISLGKIKSAELRASFFLLPLFLPVISYFIFQIFFNKPCTAGVLHNHSIAIFLSRICIAGEWLVKNMTPLFILTTGIALVKSSSNLLACRMLTIRYGITKPGKYPVIDSILFEYSKKLCTSCPRLIVTNQTHFRAFTFGILKPTIVVSKGLLNGLSKKELEAVFAHEIAHIKRKDSLVNWLAVFIRDISLFNPMAIYSFLRFLSEQEQACDDIGLSLTENATVYGQTLIKVWRNSGSLGFKDIAAGNPGSNPGFLRSIGLLEKRIKKVFDFQPEKNMGRLVKWLLIASVIFFTLIFLAFFC